MTSESPGDAVQAKNGAEPDDGDITRLVHAIFISIVVGIALLDAIGYYFAALPEPVRQVLFISDFVCALVLMTSVVIQLVVRQDRWQFFWRLGWLDLLGSIPGLPLLRFLWLPQLVQLRRSIRRSTPSDALVLARRRLAESTLAITGLIMLALVTVCSCLVVLVEAGAPNANIVTGGDAVWWAFVTIATVGYGDQYPVTPWGRIFGVALIIGGVAMFSVITSYVASTFLRHGHVTSIEIASLRQEIAALRRANSKSETINASETSITTVGDQP